MRTTSLCYVLVAASLASACPPRPATAQADLVVHGLCVRIDQRGQLTSLSDPARQREYLAAGQPAPLLTVKVGGKLEEPTALTWDARAGVATIRYAESGVLVRVKAAREPTHVVFEIVGIEPANVVDAVIWGPYPTTIRGTVGEIVGVVRDTEYAIGLQVLNIKTLGGFPLNDSAFGFHLEPEAVGTWRLYPFHASPRFTAERAERQPGESTATRWSFSNPDEEQALQFRVQVTGAGGSVSRLVFEVDAATQIEFPVELQAGESLVGDGTATARVYDAMGRQKGTITALDVVPRLATGAHTITFDCRFSGDPAPRVEVTFKTRGVPERASIVRR